MYHTEAHIKIKTKSGYVTCVLVRRPMREIIIPANGLSELNSLLGRVLGSWCFLISYIKQQNMTTGKQKFCKERLYGSVPSTYVRYSRVQDGIRKFNWLLFPGRTFRAEHAATPFTNLTSTYESLLIVAYQITSA